MAARSWLEKKTQGDWAHDAQGAAKALFIEKNDAASSWQDVPETPECQVPRLIAASEYAKSLAAASAGSVSGPIGKLRIRYQIGRTWSYGGGSFNDLACNACYGYDAGELTETIDIVPPASGSCSGCGGGGPDAPSSGDAPAPVTVYDARGGGPAAVGRDVPTPSLAYGALTFRAYPSLYAARGLTLRNTYYGGPAFFYMPGLGPMTSDAIVNMPGGHWGYSSQVLDNGWTFQATVTDGEGNQYIYEATKDPDSASDPWNDYLVPISRIKYPDGSTRCLFDNELITGTKQYKITRQYLPGTGGQPALLYIYDDDSDHATLDRVAVDSDGDGVADGRELKVAYDAQGRLTSFSDGCAGCGAGQTIEYVDFDPVTVPNVSSNGGTPFEETIYTPQRLLVKKRRVLTGTTQGEVLAEYQYDDQNRITRISRGSGSTYQVLREIEYDVGTNEDRLIRDYVDATNYELTRETKLLPAQGGSIFRYTELNGEGDELETSFSFDSLTSEGKLLMRAHLPEGKEIRHYFRHSSASDNGRLLKQCRWDGSSEKLITEYTDTDDGTGRRVIDTVTSPYGGVSDTDYADGHVTKQLDPEFGDLGATPDKRGETQFTYTADGQVELEKRKLPDGTFVTTQYEYDSSKRLHIRRENYVQGAADNQDGKNFKTIYDYSGYNQAVTVTDARAVEQHRAYTAAGRPKQVYTLEMISGAPGTHALDETTHAAG